MPLKKIADLPEFAKYEPCQHPEHNPPSHVHLKPGVYEYECPGCHRKTTFRVEGKYLG